MLAAAGLVVALLSPPPAEAPGEESSERGIVVIECFIPEDPIDAEVIWPEGVEAMWQRRRGPKLEIHVRTSFFAILTERSAGM